MKNRIITHETDLDIFAKKYAELSDHGYNLEFLKHVSLVRAFYNKEGEMCGGYVINTNTPQRYLNDLQDQESILVPEITEKNSVESCTGWVHPSLSPAERGQVFTIQTLDILSKRRKYALIGAKNPRLANRFRIIYPHYLYKGPAVSGGRANILYTKCSSMYLHFLIIFYIFWIRPLFQTEPKKKTV